MGVLVVFVDFLFFFFLPAVGRMVLRAEKSFICFSDSKNHKGNEQKVSTNRSRSGGAIAVGLGTSGLIYFFFNLTSILLPLLPMTGGESWGVRRTLVRTRQ